MFKFFFIPKRRSVGFDSKSPDWIRDPLSHPAIEAMDERQLADLPFGVFQAGRESCEGRDANN